jgi:putative ABC transport system permease protein
MRKVFYLVRQNLKRKRFRASVMLVSMVLACAMLFGATVLSKGVQHTLQTSRERLGADIVAVPADAQEEAGLALISGNPTTFYMPAALEEKVRAMPQVKQTCVQVYLRSLDSPCCVLPVALVGYDPERDFTITPWVLQNTRGVLQNNQIIVGAKVITAVIGSPVKAIGQRLLFMGKPFTVATILEPTGLGTDYTVFLTMDTAYQMTRESPLYPVPVTKDQISTILIQLEAGADPNAVAADIEQRIPELKVLTAGQLTSSFSRQLQNLVRMLFVAGGVFALLALILVGGMFSLSVQQRMRELGLIRAMGARRSFVFQLIVLEAVCIAGAGGLLGILLGFSVIRIAKDAITDMVGNVYMWPSEQYFFAVACLGLLASLVTGVLGGLPPACRMIRLEPYEAIRQGE